MKTKVIISLFFTLFATHVQSQSINVSSFRLLDSDLTANTTGTIEKDQNGETAALIKVVTTQTGFTFDGGALGIVKTKQTPGEIWVYVPRGAKKITIKHPQLGVLRDYYYPITISAARTYEMIITTGTVQTIVKEARQSQYVVFQLSPPNAVVELDGALLQTVDGTATKMMKFGSYDYRVQAPNYISEAGKVTVNDPENKKIVNVSLKPNFSKVVVKVDNDAEIWINGEKKGNGSWSGELGEGTYEFEAKKQGHRSTRTTRDIIVKQEVQTITLQSPTPIYGEADINSSPAMADIYIDGVNKGKTPLLISKLLIGPHHLRISKEGYLDFNSTFVIKENLTESVLGRLEKATNISTVPQNIASTSINDGEIIDKDKKAKEYNRIVDYTMEKINKTVEVIAENIYRREMGQREIPYDSIELAEDICNAIYAAIECNKYDQMPDAKGKVKPKYAEKNAARIWAVRPNLVNIGQTEAQKGNDANVLKYWGIFVDSAADPFFAAQDHNPEKEYIGQVAFFAGRYAYQAGDMDRANRYFEVAKQDPNQKADAVNFQLYALRSSLKTHQDSINYINQLKKMYEQEPENDVVLDGLNSMYEGMKDKVAQAALLDAHLAKFPNNFAALANKGLMAVNDNNAEEGAKWLRKATQAKPDNAAVWTYLGACLSVLASNAQEKADATKYYDEAIAAFDKAKELDPNKQVANWGYNRYQAYYGRYGADDPKTKAAEADK